MNARTVTTLVAGIFLMTVAQLLTGLVNVYAALVCAALIAPAQFGIHRFFQAEIENLWLEIGAPVFASAIGVAIAFFATTRDPLFFLAPIATAAVGGLIVVLTRSGSRRCSLCNRRIGRGVAFECPRCALLVCEQTCWSFEHCRCRLCEQNRVPAFPADGRWWDKQFGPRSSYGRCQLCMAAAEEADLRVCGKCGRPQCRDCWDYSNGQCSRCQWTVQDLPEALRDFIINPAPAERSGRR